MPFCARLRTRTRGERELVTGHADPRRTRLTRLELVRGELVLRLELEVHVRHAPSCGAVR